jgi:hypothetical protein
VISQNNFIKEKRNCPNFLSVERQSSGFEEVDLVDGFIEKLKFEFVTMTETPLYHALAYNHCFRTI